MNKITNLLFLILIFQNCSHKLTKMVLLEHEAALKSTEAIIRKEQVSNITYKVKLELDKTGESFPGNVQMEFKFKPNGHPLRIDYQGEIKKVTVNNVTFTNYTDTKYYLLLDETQITKVSPTLDVKINIEFNSNYNKQSSALYRFIDPQDDNTYMYTDLEPYDAHKIFPMFDQPDLKAKFSYNIIVPKDWTVISNMRETTSDLSKESNNKREWIFPESFLMSSYVLAIHAGNYQVWSDTYEDKNVKIPLRLFSRQSLAKRVRVEQFFDFTKKSFKALNEFFGMNYPYLKYDQLYVPDYKNGAMENIAAVTFSENYLDYGYQSSFAKQRLASVIYHEMAHMWFGNWVTMKWWDGLWLNESFASIMEYLGMESNNEFKDVWKDIIEEQTSAYFSDEKITTHSIQTPISDAYSASAAFDALTYQKGASVLNQIIHFIGKEVFKKGIQQYMKKHAQGNTTIDDFFMALSESYGKNLDSFKTNWLSTKGLNSIKAKYTCMNNKINSFSIEQDVHYGDEVLRDHKTRLLLLSGNKSKIIDLHYSGKSTQVSQTLGFSCPNFVFPNFQHLDYVDVHFDEQSLSTIVKSNKGLIFLKDPILRKHVQSYLNRMANNALLNMNTYYEIIKKTLEFETNLDNIKSLTESYSNAIGFYARIKKEEKLNEWEDFAWKNFQKTTFGSAQWHIWKKLTFKYTIKNIYVKQLLDIYNNPNLEQSDKWTLVNYFAVNNLPNWKEMLENEKMKDPSYTGKENAFNIEISVSSDEEKLEWYQKLVSGKMLTLEKSYGIVNSILSYKVKDLLSDELQKRKKYYRDLMSDDIGKMSNHASTFLMTRSVVPSFLGGCTVEIEQNLESIIKNNPKLNFSVMEKLLETKHDVEKCLKIISD